MIIREAVPGDEPLVAGVHVQSWRDAYRGLMPDALLDGLRTAEREARYTFGRSTPRGPRTILAVDGGAVVGFAATGPCRNADRPRDGELYALHVVRSRWGSGAGRLLIASAREHLAAAGHEHAVLWMLEGNERAARFYAADGWIPDGSRMTGEFDGVRLPEIRLRRALP